MYEQCSSVRGLEGLEVLERLESWVIELYSRVCRDLNSHCLDLLGRIQLQSPKHHGFSLNFKGLPTRSPNPSTASCVATLDVPPNGRTHRAGHFAFCFGHTMDSGQIHSSMVSLSPCPATGRFGANCEGVRGCHGIRSEFEPVAWQVEPVGDGGCYFEEDFI